MSHLQPAITFSASQLETIKATVAADTNAREFDLFMEACRSYGLDPFRKQIHAVVYSKDNPAKRKMSIIVSRDGLRVLAHRCRDYRPASEPAQIVYDESLKGPNNPKGIVSATVRLWKQDAGGEWFPVIGEAYWDEYAPITEVWEFNQEKGRREGTGRFALDRTSNWARMPIVMITKCAESQALRAGWPETFGSVMSEEEMDAAAANYTASEMLEQAQREAREARVGGRGLMMIFEGPQLEKVPLGSVADRCLAYIQSATAEDAHAFRIRNEAALREFWAHSPTDALEIKKAIEKKEADLGKVAA